MLDACSVCINAHMLLTLLQFLHLKHKYTAQQLHLFNICRENTKESISCDNILI